MNFSKIMELQLLRSLVNCSPSLAGGNSFTPSMSPEVINMLEDTVLWLLTPCESSGTEAFSSRSLSRQPVLHWVTNATHCCNILIPGLSIFSCIPLFSCLEQGKTEMLLCCLPGLGKTAQQHCLYWCRESCFVHIAGTSKHSLNKGTRREGARGDLSTNVLPRRAACVSCQLLKGLWSSGGNLQPSTQLREGLFYSGELRNGVCIFWVIRPLKISLDEINDMCLCCHHLSKKKGFETPPAPIDAYRAPNPRILSILQFINKSALFHR